MSDRLEECPFCGGKAHVHISISKASAFIRCSICSTESKLYPDEIKAREAWNKRHISYKIVEKVAMHLFLKHWTSCTTYHWYHDADPYGGKCLYLEEAEELLGYKV